MNVSYTISQKATEGLEEIWLHTYFYWSEKQADKYYNILIKNIKLIARNTTIGRCADYIKQGYRCLPVEQHLIFIL